MKRMILTLAVPILFSAMAHAQGDDQNTSNGPGVYWVPTDSSLSQYAVFELPSVQVAKDSDRTRIRYTLPRELTGAENKIELEGPASVAGKPIVLEGEHAHMDCPDSNLSQCAIHYHGLEFDEALRTRFLTQISSTPAELQSRLMVAASFQTGGEPHGFLHVVGAQKGY